MRDTVAFLMVAAEARVALERLDTLFVLLHDMPDYLVCRQGGGSGDLLTADRSAKKQQHKCCDRPTCARVHCLIKPCHCVCLLDCCGKGPLIIAAKSPL